jgi:hypothetical protein
MSINGEKPKGSKRRGNRPSRRTGSHGIDSQMKVSPATDGTRKADEPREPEGLDLGQGGWASEAISSCGEGEGRDTETPRSSQLRCSDGAGLVHELSNLMTAVLMNAQLLEWKLPPYSRLKRPVIEVERNAQRGRELLKRLRQQFGEGGFQLGTAAGQCWRAGALTAVTAQEPSLSAAGTANLPQYPATPAAPGFSLEQAELTLDCDLCTSSFFPKGDDGYER